MELKLTIPEYSDATGFISEWEDGFEIGTKIEDGVIQIILNKAGLISLGKQLIALSQDAVPSGYHLHFDEYNSLEEGSIELIIEKNNNSI